MKENKYDNNIFFEKYSQMERSKEGLAAAGEWETLKTILPDLKGTRMLDLGCGYGWHCIYAMEQGACSAVGIDISHKMLDVARSKTKFPQVSYQCVAIEEMDFPAESFDIVLSSLALHYISSFDPVVKKVNTYLKPGGSFVFSVEHPIFTSYGPQDWYYGETGEILHFPVDNYYYEGKRVANFLGENVIKYHRTLTTYLGTLLDNGFTLNHVVEPQPPSHLMDSVPGMKDEMRRPMMLIVSAVKR
ncbi:MAG: class I SAM-dependent methyltransferase [Clostridiales bacterium]|jgi:SAM-dependent methyltransferase|nr:class I SAM-dependent methyltransferase [Clostridiales bacterium]